MPLEQDGSGWDDLMINLIHVHVSKTLRYVPTGIMNRSELWLSLHKHGLFRILTWSHPWPFRSPVLFIILLICFFYWIFSGDVSWFEYVCLHQMNITNQSSSPSLPSQATLGAKSGYGYPLWWISSLQEQHDEMMMLLICASTTMPLCTKNIFLLFAFFSARRGVEPRYASTPKGKGPLLLATAAAAWWVFGSCYIM